MDFIILVMRVFLCLVVHPSFVHIQNIMCMSFVQATVSLMSCLFYRANCKNFQQRKMSRVWLFLQAWNHNNPEQNCCSFTCFQQQQSVKTEHRIWWCLPVQTTTNNTTSKAKFEGSSHRDPGQVKRLRSLTHFNFLKLPVTSQLHSFHFCRELNLDDRLLLQVVPDHHCTGKERSLFNGHLNTVW